MYHLYSRKEFAASLRTISLTSQILRIVKVLVRDSLVEYFEQGALM